MSKSRLTMNKSLVVAGTRFYMNYKYGGMQYYFGYERGVDLVLRRKGGHYIGDITNVTEDGFEVTVWILKRSASVFISYSEIEYVKPKNDFD